MLNNYFLGILTVMVKRRNLQKYKFDNKYNIIGDFDFFIKLSIEIKFYFIQEPLAIYNSTNLTIQLKIYLNTLKN